MQMNKRSRNKKKKAAWIIKCNSKQLSSLTVLNRKIMELVQNSNKTVFAA